MYRRVYTIGSESHQIFSR